MNVTLIIPAILTLVLATPLVAHSKEVSASCTGIASKLPQSMYDFKVGKWDIAWKNKTAGNTFSEFTATSHVKKIMGGDVSIDEQIAGSFKGVTFRTYDPAKEHWIVRWLPANSTFDPVITAKFENCVPVERHEQMAWNGTLAKVRTQFTHITKDRFEFHQDWSLDDEKTWITDVLYYEATRRAGEDKKK